MWHTCKAHYLQWNYYHLLIWSKLKILQWTFIFILYHHQQVPPQTIYERGPRRRMAATRNWQNMLYCDNLVLDKRLTILKITEARQQILLLKEKRELVRPQMKAYNSKGFLCLRKTTSQYIFQMKTWLMLTLMMKVKSDTNVKHHINRNLFIEILYTEYMLMLHVIIVSFPNNCTISRVPKLPS